MCDIYISFNCLTDNEQNPNKTTRRAHSVQQEHRNKNENQTD